MVQVLVFVGSIAFMLACLYGLALCIFGSTKLATRYMGDFLVSIGWLLGASAVLSLLAWPVFLLTS
jgi:hypothetical protein